MSNGSVTWYKQGLGSVVLSLILAYIFTNLDMVSSVNQTWIDRDIRGNGLNGALYFVGISVLITACGAPRQIVAFLGGYAFGALTGVMLATGGTLGGCIVTFYASKILIKPLIRQRFHKQAVRINSFLAKQPTRKTIIIRLLPVGSNVLTNLIAGSTNVSPRAFFIGCGIGYIPQMCIFSLLGKGLLVGSEWKIIVSVLLLLVSSYLSLSLYKKHRLSLAPSTATESSIAK